MKWNGPFLLRPTPAPSAGRGPRHRPPCRGRSSDRAVKRNTSSLKASKGARATTTSDQTTRVTDRAREWRRRARPPLSEERAPSWLDAEKGTACIIQRLRSEKRKTKTRDGYKDLPPGQGLRLGKERVELATLILSSVWFVSEYVFLIKNTKN